MPLSPGFAQRLQLFFREGVAFDGNRLNRTAVTAPLFKYLAPSESADERVGSKPNWNLSWLAESALVKRQLLILQSVARAVANSRPADRAVAASALLRR
jgi:hypothetical protein